jgi:hypothetical protein
MRRITEEQANTSWKQLVALEAKLDHSRVGLKALDYLFFEHRLRTKTKAGISFTEAIASSQRMEHLNSLVTRYKKKPCMRSIYEVFQLWYGSVNQFRPSIAKYVISRYSPTVGILDFSAGWGGRAMAAMSLGIPYTGVDTNTNLQEPYTKLQDYNPSSPVTMIWKPAEQVEFDFPYDMVFTSPPYWTTEVYENMPNYSCKREWLDVFLIPVIMKAWTGLLSGGTMALNFPQEMYKEVQERLPPVQEILTMSLSNRNLKHSETAQEQIYIWRKV